ncbi:MULTISPECIES: NAD(P)H-binding protein [unclassified Marinovum]|uniref:NmrA family NAD(P)-binding protein n=1 Tax=unclassified Marinovum TaxID=2647166 RepID=UPI0026E3DF86|nr:MULTISPECIES: NAD(P)H-binding protein [unclassified Marinovum]
MLIITGASGKLGGLVVEALQRLVTADQIGVSVRDPEKLADLAARGVRVRRGAYEDADSLRHAWEGANRVLLVSSNAASSGGDPVQQHETAISVAKELGVERLLYTSQVSANAQSHFPPGRHHAATETMLTASGLAWTSMRHGFYAESAMNMNAQGFANGNLVGPADSKVAWTTHEDLAQADALLLAGKETFEGVTPPLTGSEGLDLADLAQMASGVTGRIIKRQIINEDEMIENLGRANLPEPVKSVILGYYRAAQAGEFAMVDPTLERLLGRKPRPMQNVVKRHLG